MKNFPKFLSLLLVVVMVVTMISVPASAGFLVYDSFSTPYGQVQCNVEWQRMNPGAADPTIGFYASTSIASNLTMVWTYTALEWQRQSTGQVLFKDAKYAYNSNSSNVDGSLLSSQLLNPTVIFSTHSILYTTSYAKYYTATF